jgi:hypothetical protein
MATVIEFRIRGFRSHIYRTYKIPHKLFVIPAPRSPPSAPGSHTSFSHTQYYSTPGSTVCTKCAQCNLHPCLCNPIPTDPTPPRILPRFNSRAFKEGARYRAPLCAYKSNYRDQEWDLLANGHPYITESSSHVSIKNIKNKNHTKNNLESSYT